MTRAYVLMTALPPTKGHLHLIEYAAELADSVEVILCTQPGEPFTQERYDALAQAVETWKSPVNIHRIHRTLPQEPEEDPGFWDMWTGFLTDNGITSRDYIVASEAYGVKLAEITGSTFMPYDINRTIIRTKASAIRADTLWNFWDIMPSFQHNLRKRVTIFGAESCGKTTLARDLANGKQYPYDTFEFDAMWTPEWARPYLETVGAEITLEKMRAIWHGQAALQDHATYAAEGKPFIVQDTDLYSTIGYWLLKGHEFDPTVANGNVPGSLMVDAFDRKSDLYIICPSNIPFETNELRYGGDKRESDDQFWIDLCKRHHLNYVVLQESERWDRYDEAVGHMKALFGQPLTYQRHGKEYENVTA